MTAGTQSYLKRTASIKSQLPPEALARLTALEPWPEPVSRAFRHANDKIYNLMQGKSEFLVTGNLKDWERWDRLHEIRVKALTISLRCQDPI
jgi:proline iminopeptidase